MIGTVLDRGSGISVKGEAGLRKLRRHFSGLPILHPYAEGKKVVIAGGRNMEISQQTCLLTVTTFTPSVPVMIRLTVVLLPRGDDVLILGSKFLREQLNIDVVPGLKARALGRGTANARGSEMNVELPACVTWPALWRVCKK